MIERLRAVLRKTGWGFADQALSSLTNFILGIMVARSVGASDFGAFSLAFATYLLLLGVSRALTSDPLIVRFSAAGSDEHRRATAEAIGTTLVLGVIGGVGCIVASLLIEGVLGAALLALGSTLPGLLTQDSWRYAFFAGGRGIDAFLNDLVWTVVLFAAVGSVIAADAGSVYVFVLAWGGSASVAALVGGFQARTPPRVGRTWPWLRDHRDLGLPFLGQFGALIGAAQLSIYAVVSIAGLAAAGAFRAVGILLGPATMFYRGIRLTALPDAVRTAKNDPSRLQGKVLRIALVLGSFTLLWGTALLLLPEGIGRSLLGDSWPGARRILLPLTLSATLSAGTSGLEIGLRALAAAKRSFRARSAMGSSMVGLTIVGAFWDGTRGAAWGHALGMGVGVGIWIWHMRRALAEAVPVS